MRLIKTCIVATLLATAALPARADDVTDAIEEALSAYGEGDLGYAKETLDFASQLIAQQKAGTLANLLPDAIEGWDAGEAETESVGGAMFGGGTTASRVYTRGDDRLEIRFTADSPILAQMGAMLANPAMVGASGGKLIRLGRQKAMIDDSGTLQFMVDNRILVQIEGDGSDEEKTAFAKAIDLKALKDY